MISINAVNFVTIGLMALIFILAVKFIGQKSGIKTGV
jgi:hypothetical protein